MLLLNYVCYYILFFLSYPMLPILLYFNPLFLTSFPSYLVSPSASKSHVFNCLLFFTLLFYGPFSVFISLLLSPSLTHILILITVINVYMFVCSSVHVCLRHRGQPEFCLRINVPFQSVTVSHCLELNKCVDETCDNEKHQRKNI